MNWTTIFITVFSFLVLAAGAARGQDFKTDAWLEDFAQLKREMSAQYANLEWAIEFRGLDLKQLSEQTESRLRQVSSEPEAKKIIESFLATFGDGHLSVQWAQNKNNNTSPADNVQLSSPPPLCQRLSYQSQNQAPKIPFTRLNSFREINTDDSKYFSIGVLRVAEKDVGIVRISIFSEYAFPDLCEQAAVQMNLTKDSPCDAECEDRLERSAANLLTAALARQIEALKRNKISVLLVDITGNGGGTNWTEPAARTFSPKPLRSPRQQFIRHEHWTKQLKRRLEIIEADSRRSASSKRELLREAANTLQNAITESQKPCDRGGVWENLKPDCSIIAATPQLYPQSILPYAKPGVLPDQASSRFLFYPSRYAYREGIYSGPLMVLADQGTWSSAEYFAAMLRDNNAAAIIGEPTGGAGCGYTNGGIRTFLKNSGAGIKIPDCVRLRADGTNEVAGITPDVLIPWRPNDNRYQRAKRVFEALSQYLNKKTKL
ncbi:MAG TPA: S41 family peptidase [Pyrinomonadaceae bacterium]|jgi:hypothetical protein